jgi:hypothetical protein
MQSHILNWIREMRADPQAQRELAFKIALGMVCLTIGYLLGEVSHSGLIDSSTANQNGSGQTKKSWPNSYDVTVHADSSDEEAGGESGGDDEDMEGNGKELKDFGDTADEVKLVLVVRTDLNMGKGKSCQFQIVVGPRALMLFTVRPLTGCFHRQNRRASLSRHAGLLQISAKPCAFCFTSETMGERWPGKDCCTSQNGR